MKRFYFVFLFLFMSLCSFADGISYDEYYTMVNTQISSVKEEISSLNKSLKSDKNNVELHKQLVRKQTELKVLYDKKDKIKDAEEAYRNLVKQNKILDEEKTKLLHIKQQSAELDSMIIKIFK